MINKQPWIDAAEVFDTLRIVPRIVLFAFLGFTGTVIYQILHWYFEQPATARGFEESGAITAIIGFLTHFSARVFDFYMKNGRDWSTPPAAVTTTMTASKTTEVTPS